MTEPDAVLSHESGSHNPPLRQGTIGDALDDTARMFPNHLAVVARQDGSQLTFAQLRDDADRVARGLIALGLERGDRVAIWSGARSEWITAQYGVAKAGGVLVTINPVYQAAEAEAVLYAAECSWLIMSGRLQRRTIAELMDRLSRAVRGGSSQAKSLRLIWLDVTADAFDGVLWADLGRLSLDVSEDDRQARQRAVMPIDLAVILHSSGTTGRAKGVMHTHRGVINGGFLVGHLLRYSEHDRVCQPIAPSHVLGCVAAHIAALTHGSAIVYPSDGFDARKSLEAIAAERCTALYAVPTMCAAMLNVPDLAVHDRHSLRTGVISGGLCPSSLMRRIVEELHLPEVTVGYGMTEMGPILFTAVDDRLDDRMTTAGRVQAHAECKIVDPSGRTVPRGEPGELCARGDTMMRGYWNDTAATRTAIDQDGWLRTGDVAVMRADGYVSIVGRLKDIIIRGGQNIAPFEIEDALQQHPDVVEAHVVAAPDAEFGEEVCAWVRPRAGSIVSAEELRRHCRQRLAAFKIPRYFQFANEFPVASTGKVQKFRLREATAELLKGLAGH